MFLYFLIFYLFIYLFIHFSSLSIIFISISITLLLYCTVKNVIFSFLSTETLKLLHNDTPKLYHFEINTQLWTVKRRLKQGSFLNGLLLCFYSLNKVVLCFVLTEKREKIKKRSVQIRLYCLTSISSYLLFRVFFQIFFWNLKMYHLHFNSSTWCHFCSIKCLKLLCIYIYIYIYIYISQLLKEDIFLFSMNLNLKIKNCHLNFKS